MNLDEYEQDILDFVESEEWTPNPHLKERVAELQQAIKGQKKKALSIRVAERDIYELKKKALESGIPYQNIVQILIHQYAENKITLSL